jgi:hypothetical protein
MLPQKFTARDLTELHRVPHASCGQLTILLVVIPKNGAQCWRRTGLHRVPHASCGQLTTIHTQASTGGCTSRSRRTCTRTSWPAGRTGAFRLRRGTSLWCVINAFSFIARSRVTVTRLLWDPLSVQKCTEAPHAGKKWAAFLSWFSIQNAPQSAAHFFSACGTPDRAILIFSFALL